MSEQEILEGNKLIAEFLEIDKKIYGETGITYYIDGIPYQIFKLKYYSSWDWLMPVVEKIQSLNYVYEICNGACRIKIPTDRGWWLEETTIKSVFSAVIEFIKWYNSNEKN